MFSLLSPPSSSRLNFSYAAFLWLLSALLLPAAPSGNEVVVVYNRKVPESKGVADYYAQKRQVPTNQVIGLDLPGDEVITRAQFNEQLQKPLLKALKDGKLMVFPETTPATNHLPISAKFRYLALCYGVPLKIAPDSTLKEEGGEKAAPELRRNEAAVDSELACLPIDAGCHLLRGPLRNPFYGTTNADLIQPTNGILMVTRLDGPSAEIARGLVDSAMLAEAVGLWGRGYFDARGLDNNEYRMGDIWIKAAEEACRLYGFDTVLDTNAATFKIGFPASLIAFYAGWYDAQVSGPFTLPVVEFMPGAFGYHLHSYSAITLRSTNQNWVGPMLAKGVAASMGSVYEPYLTGTPDVATFAQRWLHSHFTFGEAAYAGVATLSWQTTMVGDPLYCPTLKPPQILHVELEKQQSPLLEWSHLRVVNLNQARKFPIKDVIGYLEQLPLTRTSATLTEKLAELYWQDKQFSNCLLTYADVLKMTCSPQQRVRLLQNYGAHLKNMGREKTLFDVYELFLKNFPDHPDRKEVWQNLAELAKSLGRSEAEEKYRKLLQASLAK